MLIRIKNKPRREGIWKIFSCQASGRIDLGRPDVIKMLSKSDRIWREVSVKSLLKSSSIEKFKLIKGYREVRYEKAETKGILL